MTTNGTTEVTDIESAMKELATKPLTRAHELPGSTAEAISKQVSSIMGRVTLEIIQRSQALRAEMEEAEKEMVRHLQDVSDGVLDHIQRADNMLKLGEAIRDHMEEMREKIK